MLEKTLTFIVFLCPLIFFHELGHFFFARFFGVRVEVFSIGFGPKIFKYLHKGTEYAISIIPLGGYVKMFGDDPFSQLELSEEDKKVAFNHKSKWARFWIVFGGPLANLILAYVLYVGLLGIGEKVPETKVGMVQEKSFLFEKGLRAGDVLVGINDDKVLSFDDLNISGSMVDKISVLRNGQKLDLAIQQPLETFIKELFSSISLLRKPIFINTKGESFVLSTNENGIDQQVSWEELILKNSSKLYMYSSMESKIKEQGQNSPSLMIEVNPSLSLEDQLIKKGFFPRDLSIKNVVMSSPADKAGLRKGDIIVRLNQNQLKSFEDLRRLLQDLPEGQAVELTYISGATEVSKMIVPEVKKIDKKKVKILGVESFVEYMEPNLVTAKADSVLTAITGAFSRTWDGIIKTFSGYKKLIMREVSLDNIGGPLAIGKVASDSLNISLSMFFRLMAIISINLGVINLFPIPVLDGGHIVFLILEFFNRGPLSRKKLELAQRIGLAILLSLIFIALFNDFSRLF